MNSPAIPRNRKGGWSKEAEKLIRDAYRELLKGHKKDGIAAAANLRRLADKLFLEAHDRSAKRAFFGPKAKLLEPHPSWRTGRTLADGSDRVTRW